MIRELRLDPLQRPHRPRVLPAKQQRQQRHEQADADTLEGDHHQGADEDCGEEPPSATQVGTKLLQKTRDVGDLLEPGLHMLSSAALRLTESFHTMMAIPPPRDLRAVT